ncbi:tetratricopeptide repeat protein [Patescibacteria group bacterium]|nr:tetratricopeptide repeat protein [Patescibacteria group bacterium]
MNTKVKQSIALGVTIVALALVYLSAYLPYVKSTLYINALQKAQQATTLQDYLAPFQTAFDFWSPVGQPEELRFFGNDILSLLTNQKQQLPQDVATALVNYAVGELNSNPPGARGLNYTQSILIEASILSAYGQEYKQAGALQKAEELYKEGLQLSPNRPQFLYGLFSLYLAEGNAAAAKPIGEEILKYWPNDPNVPGIMAQLSAAK